MARSGAWSLVVFVSSAALAEPAFQNAAAESLWLLPAPTRFEQLKAELKDWRLEETRIGSGEFFATMLDGGALPSSQAFELAHKLKGMQLVTDVDPAFTAQSGEESLEIDAGVSQRAEDWHLRAMHVPEAWALFDGGLAAVSTIRIGHPDSGRKVSREAPPIFWQHDFIEDDDDAFDPFDDGHGLATASVFGSADNRLEDPHSVTGVAPGVGWMPLRVSRPHWFIPSPVLFGSGVRRLTKAIDRAVDQKADVISISLGWLGNEGLHRAIQRAVKANVIVIAAAGNYTGPIVVWPARYEEVIAMAASGPGGAPWAHSAHGSAVDVTAPGHEVWVAGLERGRRGSGTSFAVANVAGLAALWLAHHGKSNLEARYGNVPLQEVFRATLIRSAVKQPLLPSGFGAGHVDALACLRAPLQPFQALKSFLPFSLVKRDLNFGGARSSAWKSTFKKVAAEPLFQRELLVSEATMDPEGEQLKTLKSLDRVPKARLLEEIDRAAERGLSAPLRRQLLQTRLSP